MNLLHKSTATNYVGMKFEHEGRTFNVSESPVLNGRDYREVVKNPNRGWDQKKIRAKGLIAKLDVAFNANL